MQKRHFEALAAELKEVWDNCRTDESRDVARDMIVAVADVCQRSNIQFKRERFYAAIGVE